MALVKLGALITDIRGKVGGQVFARGIGGLTFKNVPQGKKNGSPSAQLVDIVQKYVQNYWAQLTPAQRQSWNVFAQNSGNTTHRSGTIQLSGYTTFIQYNYHYYSAGFGILTSPSFLAPSTSPLTCDIEKFSPTILNLLISRTLDNTKEFLAWSVSGIRRPSRSVDIKALRHGSYVSSAVDTVNISPRYEELFGYLPDTGDLIYVGWILLNKSGIFIQKEKAVAINVK